MGLICKIADLYVEIPTAGGIAPRLGGYLADCTDKPHIVIDDTRYAIEAQNHPQIPYETVAYLESGSQFYRQLLAYDGLMLHASAIALDGRAYLFSGPSGMGKSTHTRLWKEIYKDRVTVFNDDKPALRRIDGEWLAYGTPWCGKDGINENVRVSLAGICFLKRGEENSIRRLSVSEATPLVISQTLRKFHEPRSLDLMIGLVERLVTEIPVYELYCRPDTAAAMLSSSTMINGAEK